jgi:hypothetical protein
MPRPSHPILLDLWRNNKGKVLHELDNPEYLLELVVAYVQMLFWDIAGDLNLKTNLAVV